METKKHFEYAALITAKLAELFSEDSDVRIDMNELREGDNLESFFHALSTLAPTVLFNDMTGSDEDVLGFNHLANRLCFQYSHKNE